MPRTILAALLACATLASCGADGEPQPPGQPGISFTGEAKVGIGG